MAPLGPAAMIPRTGSPVPRAGPGAEPNAFQRLVHGYHQREEAPMDDFEKRRQRAHQLWVDEGRPQGKAEEHWKRARETVANEDRRRTAPDTQSAPPIMDHDVGSPAQSPPVTDEDMVATITDRPKRSARTRAPSAKPAKSR